MQRTVDGSHAVSNCGIHLDQAFLFQQKLYANAGDMKLPRWAVPDVFATWNAIRNREGKGPVKRQTSVSESTNSANGGLL
ncbi:hypothetical protein PtB15_3B524 [Puccinia triticina]|nr:hypothetical protein PtB15_3B524 [Puccinia triticina]